MDQIGYDEKGATLLGEAARRRSNRRSRLAHRPEPCAVVLFGVTGDLASRKLVPALYDLACHNVLPRGFSLVGYGRKPMSGQEMRVLSRDAIDSFFGTGTAETRTCNDMLNDVHYVQGQFDDPDGYERLADTLAELDRTKRTGGNRIFYLATPPSLFPVIIARLGAAGLQRGGVVGTPDEHGENRGWVRVVIEKPFGSDLDSARALNAVVRSAFDERQVYRIDHYLGKETVQNILVFRFANGIFEPIWNRRYIDHVQITAAETLGVEHRGAYYEEAGALRDMIQNHLLQLLDPDGHGAAGGLRRRRGARRESQGAARRTAHPGRARRAVRRARPVRGGHGRRRRWCPATARRSAWRPTPRPRPSPP